MIYLDNAATTWPKPPDVVKAMTEYLLSPRGNPGRGGHVASVQASQQVFKVREKLVAFFGADDPNSVVFTHNATQALNQALFGLLEPGDHVITSSLEHNAVTRPLHALHRLGVDVTEIPVVPGQAFPWDAFEQAFRKTTRLVVTLHASNVTGTVLPVQRIGRIARRHNVLYLLDASQTAGIFSIDLGKLPVDLLAFPGHKGLLGPQGTGGLIIRPGVQLKPLLYGGTGSLSESDDQPDFFPDALESGTLNAVGIVGLGAALDYLTRETVAKGTLYEQALCQRLLDGLKSIPGVRIYGGLKAEEKAPIVSFNVRDIPATSLSYAVEQTGEIIARAGLHCAPHAHKTLGTLSQGTVRLSPSHATTEAEIDKTLEVIDHLAKTL